MEPGKEAGFPCCPEVIFGHVTQKQVNFQISTFARSCCPQRKSWVQVKRKRLGKDIVINAWTLLMWGSQGSSAELKVHSVLWFYRVFEGEVFLLLLSYCWFLPGRPAPFLVLLPCHLFGGHHDSHLPLTWVHLVLRQGGALAQSCYWFLLDFWNSLLQPLTFLEGNASASLRIQLLASYLVPWIQDLN